MFSDFALLAKFDKTGACEHVNVSSLKGKSWKQVQAIPKENSVQHLPL